MAPDLGLGMNTGAADAFDRLKAAMAQARDAEAIRTRH